MPSFVAALLLVLAASLSAAGQGVVLGGPNEKQQSERLHEIIRHSPGESDIAHHDAYGELISVGNEESVPLLLDRLREYRELPPNYGPGIVAVMVCTQGHLIAALQSITNTDRGSYYSGWAQWWRVNRERT